MSNRHRFTLFGSQEYSDYIFIHDVRDKMEGSRVYESKGEIRKVGMSVDDGVLIGSGR